jgi:RWD domain
VGENLDQQYVCLTLAVIFSPNYPNEVPKFRISNPRGLSDQCLATIEKAIVEKLTEMLGQPVVFDLIEVVRDHLTESNLPTGQCVICLYGFCEGECPVTSLSKYRNTYPEHFAFFQVINSPKPGVTTTCTVTAWRLT